MNCTSCGAALSPGVTSCPLCGMPTPYNASRQSAPSPYGSSPYDPTVAAPQNSPQVPPTAYGAPPPAQSNPYGYPSAPSDPYNTPSSPYGSASSVPSNPYGAQPNANPQYGAQPNNYGYVPGTPGTYGANPQQPPKRRSRIGLIIGITALVLVLGCVGIVAAVAIATKNAVTSVTATVTSIATTAPTQPQTGNVPPNSAIVPAAAAILSGPQTASAIDSNYVATKTTSTFTAKQTVYVTFHANSNGSDGYIGMKWYLNGQQINQDSFHHSAANDHGYFSLPYNDPGNGAAAMYWCTKSDCSDEQLALIVHFTVNAAALVPTQQSGMTMLDINRKQYGSL